MRLETTSPIDDATGAAIAELLAADRVREALGAATAAGATGLSLWVSDPTPAHDELARAAGLVHGRDIFQMRRPLPAEEPPPGFATRPFRVGQDEHAWLETNNRAFAGHDDQSGWDEARLTARMAEPWFDPDGFRLHERDGRLAGFCWTKVHADHDPPLGEIHVIAVDPDFGGLGLGRALVLDGLAWLHRHGVEIGMLYVDASNAPALALYRKLGFTVDHTDRGYYAPG